MSGGCRCWTTPKFSSAYMLVLIFDDPSVLPILFFSIRSFAHLYGCGVVFVPPNYLYRLIEVQIISRSAVIAMLVFLPVRFLSLNKRLLLYQVFLFLLTNISYLHSFSSCIMFASLRTKSFASSFLLFPVFIISISAATDIKDYFNVATSGPGSCAEYLIELGHYFHDAMLMAFAGYSAVKRTQEKTATFTDSRTYFMMFGADTVSFHQGKHEFDAWENVEVNFVKCKYFLIFPFLFFFCLTQIWQQFLVSSIRKKSNPGIRDCIVTQPFLRTRRRPTTKRQERRRTKV